MSRLFEKNCEKLLTYCVSSDIIINCITIACIPVGFFEKDEENQGRYGGFSLFAAALQAVEKYKFHQSKGKLKFRME